jgi:polar amino acid transport system substrate-binding protein
MQSYKQQTDVTTALVTGKVDALYADSPVTGYAIEQTGDKLQKLGEDQGVAPQAVAIKKGDSADDDQPIQQAIQKLIDDGTSYEDSEVVGRPVRSDREGGDQSHSK